MLKRRSYVTLIDETLSDELRGDVRYLVSRTLFDGVWYLSACERSFLEDLSLCITREGYAPGEVVATGDTLTILVQGVCSRAGAILTQGAYWGDAIISSPMLRDTRDAKTLAYAEVARLERSAITKISAGYPRSAQYLRYAGLMLATKRSLVITAMIARIVDKGAQKDATQTQRAEAKLKWAQVRSEHKPKANTQPEMFRRLFRSKHKDEKAALEFIVDTPPVRTGIKPGNILQAMHQNNVVNSTGWREISYAEDGLPEELGKAADDSAAAETVVGSDRGGIPKDLVNRIDALVKLVEATEANRRADSREMFDRLSRLEQSSAETAAAAKDRAAATAARNRRLKQVASSSSIEAPQRLARHRVTKNTTSMTESRSSPPPPQASQEPSSGVDPACSA